MCDSTSVGYICTAVVFCVFFIAFAYGVTH